jgi:predicted transcriptional regulator
MSRYTVDLSGQIDTVLGELAEKDSSTKAEVLRRALLSYATLKQAVEREEGGSVAITNQEGTPVKEVIIP